MALSLLRLWMILIILFNMFVVIIFLLVIIICLISCVLMRAAVLVVAPSLASRTTASTTAALSNQHRGQRSNSIWLHEGRARRLNDSTTFRSIRAKMSTDDLHYRPPPLQVFFSTHTSYIACIHLPRLPQPSWSAATA